MGQRPHLELEDHIKLSAFRLDIRQDVLDFICSTAFTNCYKIFILIEDILFELAEPFVDRYPIFDQRKTRLILSWLCNRRVWKVDRLGNHYRIWSDHAGNPGPIHAVAEVFVRFTHD